MITFVICEDNSEVREIYKKIINKALINNDIDYKIFTFEKYSSKLKKKIEEASELKIYIIDLEMPVKDGIQITREIRKNDWDSQIIILTAHEELELRVLKQRLLILDFISKFDNYEQKLIDSIKLIIEKRKTNKTLKIKIGRIIHNIKLEDIIYIIKEKKNKKIKIITKEKEYRVNQSLKVMESKLDSRFCKTHRSCIVNKDKIEKIDNKENKIYLKDSKEIDYISRTYKINLKE